MLQFRIAPIVLLLFRGPWRILFVDDKLDQFPNDCNPLNRAVTAYLMYRIGNFGILKSFRTLVKFRARRHIKNSLVAIYKIIENKIAQRLNNISLGSIRERKW